MFIYLQQILTALYCLFRHFAAFSTIFSAFKAAFLPFYSALISWLYDTQGLGSTFNSFDRRERETWTGRNDHGMMPKLAIILKQL